jgi:hypothetical protein
MDTIVRDKIIELNFEALFAYELADKISISRMSVYRILNG